MLETKKSELLEKLANCETLEEAKGIKAELDQVNSQIQLAAEKKAAIDAMKTDKPVEVAPAAKTLGEFAAKNLNIAAVKGVPGGSTATPYFKGTQTVTHVGVPEVTTSKVVPDAAISTPALDALGKEEIDGNAYQWVVMVDGDNMFAVTAEGAKKPEMAYAYGTVTSPLQNIAGWWKETQQLLDDNAYLETAIENRGIRLFNAARENIIVGGLDTTLTQGITVTGGTAAGQPAIVAPTELITETTPTAPQIADHIFNAMAEVKDNTGVDADAIIITPDVAKVLRTGRDTNGQYYGGGYFLGAYGNGGVELMPNLWGLKVIVSDAMDTKTQAIVGNFALGASYITKRGEGMRVNVTNSNEDDFIYNLLTVRIEERGLLAVRNPQMFCRVVVE